MNTTQVSTLASPNKIRDALNAIGYGSGRAIISAIMFFGGAGANHETIEFHRLTISSVSGTLVLVRN